MSYRKNAVVVLLLVLAFSCRAFALSSPNIPLDSPVYLYIEKLSGFGLVTGDFKGIRPYSRSEAARLLAEAEEKLPSGSYPPLAHELVARLKEMVPREASLRLEPQAAPSFDFNPFANVRLRYLYLDGAPRNYDRLANDPGRDWIFPLPQLRMHKDYPTLAHQRGNEGTPMAENNEGIVYHQGNNFEGRWSAEAYAGSWGCALVEPLLLWSEHRDAAWLRLNKGYLKVGGGALELEAGKDANWLGMGYRGALILTNNAQNFTQVKLSSPEPVDFKYFWDFKYALIVSQFDKTFVDGVERQPIFYALKISMKPLKNLEFALNLGRQVGGPGTGLDNSAQAYLKGLIGATTDDNSNTLAGGELRMRIPRLANTELYLEFAGEDRSDFWPMADSYVAGILVPRLTQSGRDDLRFEYFLGHQILYSNGTFPAGYIYHGLPIGHSQGGATQDFFLRYSHWFTVRNTLALEVFRTTRGDEGRIPVDATGNFDPVGGVKQALEETVGGRAQWRVPLYGEWDANLLYGYEHIRNFNLVPGNDQDNHLLRLEVSYRY